MNIQYYKLRLLGQPFRCGGGGGGGGGGDSGDSGDGGTGAASSATGDAPGAGASGTGNGTDGGGDPGSVGVGEVGAASPGAGGTPAGPGDPGISDSSSGGLTASEQASLDAQAAADAAASAAADAAAAAAADAAASAAAQAQAQEGLAQAIASLGISATEASMMGMSNATGSNVATNGMTQAELGVMSSLGLGNMDISSTQTVDQALASMNVHASLNENIGSLMSVIGGPAIGAVATAANAIAQGHSAASVIGQIAASIVGTAITNATGISVNANTISAIANGQIGQAALGIAIGQVAQSTGLSIGTVTAALSGNLGMAVANTVTGAVIGQASQALGQNPGMVATIGQMTGMTQSAATAMANAINSNAVVAGINSAVGGLTSSVASIGVPGGIGNVGAAINGEISGIDTSPATDGAAINDQQGSLLISALKNNPAAITAANNQPAPPKAKIDYWGNLLSDLSVFQSPPQKTPAQQTPQPLSEYDAKRLATQTLGREPTEFELLELIGLPESFAKPILEGIHYDESYFDQGELIESYKALYGKEPTNEWLASDEAMDMLERSETQSKNMLNQYYTKDKNWVTEEEAQQFWKDAGNKGSMPQTFMDELLMTSEAGAKAMSETYRIRKEDLDATTFDGTKYKDQKEAQAAAIKNGYNNYTFGDKNYYLMSPDQAETLKKDIAAGKTAGPKPDAFFTSVPGMSLEQQLAAAGNPDSYAYMQGDVIHVVAKRLAVPDYEDLEAWNEFKEEKKAAGGDNFQSFLTEQFSILEQAMKGAPKDSVAKVMADAAMFGYGKMAQLVQAFSGAGEAAGIPQAERATNIANQVQSWSKKLVDQGIQNAESAVLANVAAVTKETIAAERGVKPSDISTAELYAKKTGALFKQIPDNPLGVSLFLTGEAIQEIPLLAISGGVGNVLKTVATRGIQMAGATGTNVFLNGTESFGGNYNEVKDYLKKQGVPDSQIEALAIKSGFEAAAIGMLTSYVGDRALIKSFMGDLAKDSFGKVIANNSTKEWFLGNFEGSLQNMSAQIGKYGSIKSEDEWLNAGIMEGFAQKGIAAGVLTADALSQVVAKDYDGKPVTYQEIISGDKTFDPKTIDKSFSYGTGVNLGDAIGYHSTFITNPDITPDEYFYTAQTFRENGMNDFTPQEIASIVSGAGEMSPQQISELALPYAQERVVTKEEAQQMMRDLGYTNMTDAEAMSFAGQISEAAAREKVEQYVNPRQVTRAEAEDFFKSIEGYKPTEDDITSFIRQGENINQEAVKNEVGAYVDLRMVDEQEVRDAYKELGLDAPTQADIDKLIGQYNQEMLAGRAQENLGTAQYNSLRDQIVSEEEIQDIVSGAVGSKTTKPTEADVSEALKIVVGRDPFDAKYDWDGDGKVDLNDTLNLLKSSLGKPTTVPAAEESFWAQPTGLYKEIDDAIAGIKFPASLTKADVTDSVAKYMEENPGLSVQDVVSAVSGYMAENPGLTSTDLDAAISAATKDLATTEQVGDVQEDVDALGKLIGEPGKDDVAGTGIIGQLEAMGLVDSQIKGLIGSPADGDTAPTGLYKVAEDAAVRGENAAAAVQAEFGKVVGTPSVKDDPSTPDINESVAATGLYGQIEAGNLASQAAINDVKDLIGVPGTDDASGTGIIGQLEAMGATDIQIQNLVGKPATETDPATGLYKSAEDAAVRGENAAAAVQKELSTIIGAPSVKDDPATLDVDEALAATGLYGQIEASQAETAGAIGELATDVQDKFDALTTEQKALATSLQQQGVDLNTAIETAKTQTQQQITDLGIEVDARINELMQQGQTYQQATQTAFAEVNAKNQEMAGLIGTQGRTANQSDIDALTEMLGGQRSMDLAYDVTGDKQITQADIDFLTQVVGGTKTDWTAPDQSPWAATGLYGQIQANELQRQQDLAAAEAQRVADQQAAAQAAAERDRQANIRTTATRAQTSAQGIMQQLEAMQRAGMAPQQPAQLVEAGPGFDVSAALNTGFFSGFQAKKAQQNQQPTTKIAAGGYIDDLLAGDLSVDELLDLLR
jgi:hypothetical protein